MGKQCLTVFVLAIITTVLSFVASLCDVRSGANRGWVFSGDATYYYDDLGDEYPKTYIVDCCQNKQRVLRQSLYGLNAH